MPKICLTAMNSPVGYSGGRYHAWILAEALAAAGFDVTYWTNATPLVSKDFQDYPAHKRIKLHVDAFFNSPPKGHFDIGWMVPHYGQVWVFSRWMQFFMKSADRRVMLNFETPNWYREAGQTEIDESKWLGWKLASAGCDAIVSSLEISSRYAREYFTDVPAHTQFLSLPPAINSIAADRAKETPRHPKRIFMPTRMNKGASAHKGSQYISQLLTEDFRGYELALLIGGASGNTELIDSLEKQAQQHDIKLHLLSKLTDDEKFRWYASSAVTLFPSSFEGYGYPPIESLYCGTPCIAFDLPNYDETCGNTLLRVPQGDFASIRTTILNRLSDLTVPESNPATTTGSFNTFTQRSREIATTVLKVETSPSNVSDFLPKLSNHHPPRSFTFWLKTYLRSKLPTQATSLKKAVDRLIFFK